MNSDSLKDKTVAILATDGFEESELLEPRRALLDAGATVKVISLKTGSIKGWKHTDWGQSVDVDLTVADAQPDAFDALVLPGGVMNPDKLRTDENAVAFVRQIGESGKPIAAICHGPWTLVNADLVHGRTLTSWPSLQADLVNAGATWVDQEVVVDQGLVTSRKPDDLPAFNRKMIEEIAEGTHRVKRVA
jgi:protease I